MEKKILLLVSFLGSLLVLVATYSVNLKLCSSYYSFKCTSLYNSIGQTFLISIFIFLFTLITYKISERVFRAWSIFTYIWIPLSMILTSLASEESGGFIYPSDKALAVMFTIGLYILISIIIILTKLYTTRGQK